MLQELMMLRHLREVTNETEEAGPSKPQNRFWGLGNIPMFTSKLGPWA